MSQSENLTPARKGAKSTGLEFPHLSDHRASTCPSTTIMKFCIAAITILFFASCTINRALPAGSIYGETMQTRDSVRFAVVDAAPKEYFEQTLLVEATALAVCQKAGCWMQIVDDGKKAMVRWESGCGGQYTFPKDLAGQRILIQGSFYPKSITEEDAQHIEEEAGQPIDIAREGYEFNASSILVFD